MAEEVKIVNCMKKPKCISLLEPSAILISFALALTDTVLTDLIVYRTCLVSLNINSTHCSMLRQNAGSLEAVNLETKIEPYASVTVMSKSVIESVLPAMVALFLGPWSDQGGRRPLLLAGFSGFAIMYGSLSLMCNWNISPWYLLCASIPANIVGGLCTLILASLCYISDTTSGKGMMVQFTLLEASAYIGDVLGALSGPLIHEHYGYANVFRTATVCCALALAYIYFCIPETVKNPSKKSISGLFKISLVTELLTSASMQRVGLNRPVLWLGISTLTLSVMIRKGYMTIGFLFTRVRLGWDVSRQSYFYTADVLLSVAGLCTISVLTPILGLSDTFLATVALVSSLGCAITKSLTWQSWHLYLASGIQIFGGVIVPVTRSIISKSVPPQDIGKILSLTTFLETSSPLVGAPLFTLIFSDYLPPIYPSPVYLLSASLFVLLIICVFSIQILLRKSRQSVTYTLASQNDNYCPQLNYT